MSVQDRNSQAHGSIMPKIAWEVFHSTFNSVTDSDKGPEFCNNPAEYDWKYLARKQMLIPYDCSFVPRRSAQNMGEPEYPNADHIRWEIHDVWVVEGELQPGESNLLRRRLFYVDAASWAILLGEGFDATGSIVKCYMLTKAACEQMSLHGKWYRL